MNKASKAQRHGAAAATAALDPEIAETEVILRWAAEAFPGRVALASSLGAEDQVLIDLIARRKLEIAVFTLDTGRLFPETRALIAETERQYRLHIERYLPDRQEVETLVRQHGEDAHRQSVELRRTCCEIRKLRPLRQALKGRLAWICGLRSGQAATRTAVSPVEWDPIHQMVKINPLAAWSEDQVWAYIRQHGVPYNPLHDEGYPSIGCACCTRAVLPGEDIRAGRWWWEQPEHRECGLHLHVKEDQRRA
jgi:phosphoadenosine phosphosulfate reductase